MWEDYRHDIPDYGNVMTIEEFLEAVNGGFIDYDGFGHPIRGDKMAGDLGIRPSNYRLTIPRDATHVIWFNR